MKKGRFPDSSDSEDEIIPESGDSSGDEDLRPQKRLIEIEEEDMGGDTDSETEALQEAFAKGILKPGLNVIQPKAKKEFINNVPMLRQKLVELSNNLDWVERLDLLSKPASLPPELALQLEEAEKQNKMFAYDELKHESVFYRQAQDAVLNGIPKLHSLGVPTKRPEDYFAEMAKTDDHMQKVKSQLIKKKAVTERIERGKQLRQQRKLQKALQAESRVKKQNTKKEHLTQIDKFKKGHIKDLKFLEKQTPKNKQISKSQLKRKHRDSKFGFGGKKRGLKSNTRESTMADDAMRKRRAGGPKHKNNKKTRPGKSRRNKMTKSK